MLKHFLLLIGVGILCCLVFHVNAGAAITCGNDYLCTEDPQDSSIVWVLYEPGQLGGPNCREVCSAVDSLCTTTGDLYNCDTTADMFHNKASFAAVATRLGFTCRDGGCWDSEAPNGQIWVSRTVTDGTRTCYFPNTSYPLFDCAAAPGNANCFGERYSLVCPCTKKTMETMCAHYESPPYNAETATWPSDVQTGTSCLARINYWRQRACAEGWPECPPCGLPPVVECVGCHACANSESQYDSLNGAHSSFQRCGEMVQGQGGGANCAAVIDSFVSERQVFPDSNGQVVCRGHCGPIVEPGCWGYHWGKASTSNFHTLNWRGCNQEACDDYCDAPDQNDCFLNAGETPFPGVCSGGGGNCDVSGSTSSTASSSSSSTSSSSSSSSSTSSSSSSSTSSTTSTTSISATSSASSSFFSLCFFIAAVVVALIY